VQSYAPESGLIVHVYVHVHLGVYVYVYVYVCVSVSVYLIGGRNVSKVERDLALCEPKDDVV